MIVFGSSISPFVRKVLVVAAEKGIAVESRPTNPRTSDDPDFIAASPFRKIPALKDGDYTLADSTAIVTYLEARTTSPAMIPADPKARGTAIWFEEMADTILAPAVSKVFFNRVVAQKFLNMPGNMADADDALANLLPPICAYLESATSSGSYLVGGSFGIADISVVAQLVNLELSGAPLDATKYPQLAAYYARVVARPSFAKLLAGDRAILGM